MQLQKTLFNHINYKEHKERRDGGTNLGLLSNGNREERLTEARTLLKVAITPEQANHAIEKKDLRENPATRCPFCGKVALIFLREVAFHSTAKIQIIDSS